MAAASPIAGAVLLGLWLSLASVPSISNAADGEALASVKTRGVLRCGVSEGVAGFSSQDAAGQWSGIDVDFCRALAAAALGDSRKVAFVPLKASERFPALETRRIDVLSRNTTWTLLREGALKAQFAGVLFYDNQAFMVPAASASQSAGALKGATVCVQKDTSTLSHLIAYSDASGADIKPLVAGSADEARRAFFGGPLRRLHSGRIVPCRAASARTGRLAGFRDPSRADLERAAWACRARGRSGMAHARALGAADVDSRRRDGRDAGEP
ncbi:transporter substrate-binding domain-containing protein [Paraburkholderia sp. OAS925]|uniref:transporter substrate-binding domain-containing protein n=1 Tax=Paraburkholderia sp. OAS925 TaxID=2663827 RepID=UPI00366DAE66